MTDPNARIGAYADATGLELPDGTDTFQHLQKPDLHPAGDPLAQFVKARIIDAETEPRHEFPRVYGLEAGPIAHRYAKQVRRDCVAFRRIVERYLLARLDMATAGSDRGSRLVANAQLAAWEWSMFILANRWSDHPDFRDEWRVT